MSALDFPQNPIDGQTYNGFIWRAATGTWDSLPTPTGGMPAGSILAWLSNTLPDDNWYFVDGSAKSRTTDASLFAAIGYQFGGSGDTFYLPSVAGRTLVGKNGATFATLGGTGGNESVTLTPQQAGWWTTNNELSGYGLPPSTAGFQNRVAVNTTAQSHSVLNPYLVINYIIKRSAGFSAGDSELAQRVGALENFSSGLVRVVPTSVAVGSGSATVSPTGLVQFTGVSSINLLGVLAGFRSCRLQYDITAASATNSTLGVRVMSGSTVYTGTNYFYGGKVIGHQSSETQVVGASQAQFSLGPIATAGAGSYGIAGNVEIQSANTSATQTKIQAQGTAGSSDVVYGLINGGGVLVTDVFDGLQLLAYSGTISGTLHVYGYRN